MATLVRRRNMSHRYYKPDFKDDEEVVEETEIVEEEIAVEETEEPKPTYGIVSSCGYLNVRKEPIKDADNVLRTIKLSALVVVDLDESTEDFYKVICEDGIEGYCMKDYIEIAEW